MKRPLLALAFAGLLPSTALATDGTLGDTSTGSLDLTLNVTDPTASTQIVISGLSDIIIDAALNTGFSSAGSSFCVYMNGPGTYNFQAVATPLSSPNLSANVPYSVFINDILTGGNSIPIVTVTDQDEIITASGWTPATTENCTGGTNASVLIGNVPGSPPTEVGTATATITITVEPD